MKFLAQHNLLPNDQLLLTKNALDDWDHEWVGLIPFSREITCQSVLNGYEYFPLGSTLMVEVAKDRGWKGLCYNDKFSMREALYHRNDMMNDGARVSVAQDMVGWLRKSSKTGCGKKDVFIRPDADLKHFSGAVMNAGEAADMLEDMMACASSGSYQLDPRALIVAAEPLRIMAEWRFFIVGRIVVAASRYRNGGVLAPLKATENWLWITANRLCAEDMWMPHDDVVMDVALVDRDGSFRMEIVEFNCINASGFYECDRVSVIDALAKKYGVKRT